MGAIAHPRAFNVALTEREKLRRRMERAIERLLTALDALDGDADQEPSLGSVTALNQRQWAASAGDDREEQCEDEGAQCEDEGAPTGDNEPWLGAPEEALGYGNLVCGETDDRELDRCPVDPEPQDWSPRCEIGME